jgi:hypothetical protein
MAPKKSLKLTLEERRLPKTVTFGGYECWIIATEVEQTGAVVKIQLWCHDGPMATATYDPPVPLLPQEVIIKSVSENLGLLEALIQAGIVALPHDFCCVGCVDAPVCRLLC